MKKSWKESFQNPRFRIFFFSGIIVYPLTLYFFSNFLNQIEKRDGFVPGDYILDWLPSIDLSIPIFTILWASIIYVIYHAIRDSRVFLTFLWGLSLISLSRVLSIYLVPLDPPPDMVDLVDPVVSQMFYAGAPITKDLFYSGHTASVLLAYYCLYGQWPKRLMLIAASLIGIMVLVQHVHYTIDVLVVPVFTFGVYWVVRKTLGSAI